MYFNEYDLVTDQIISYCLRSLEENSFKTTFDICSTAMACILKLRYQWSIYGQITSTW
jgi:hypothetical protein